MKYLFRRIYLGLRNIAIVIVCYGSALVRGSAKKKRGEPRKIIVLAASKLGDMVCATPIFHAIKKAYPCCKVVVMGTATYIPLHQGNPDVDEYLIWDEKAPVHESICIIKAAGADAALITTPSFSALSTLFRAGVPMIVCPRVVGGFSPYETLPYRMTRPLSVVKDHTMGSYAPAEYLKLLEPLGISATDTTKHLSFSSEAGKKADDFFKNHRLTGKVIGITVSAGNKIKEWPLSRFAEIADWLVETYKVKVVLTGGVADKEMVTKTISLMNEKTRESVVDASGQFDIDGLKALISKIFMLIGVDTGPMYIAEALGVATVDIVGP